MTYLIALLAGSMIGATAMYLLHVARDEQAAELEREFWRTHKMPSEDYNPLSARLAAVEAECADLIAGKEFQAMQRTLGEVNAELADAERDAARYRWLVQERYEFGPGRSATDDCMTAPVGLWVVYRGPSTADAIGRCIDADIELSTTAAEGTP